MADSIEKQIHDRMLAADKFEFRNLHQGLHEDAYRMADKMLQQFRKAGYASFERQGRKFIWSLTSDGRQFLEGRS